MQVTEQQIKELAQQIGCRPYYPVPPEHASWWGITIRQELMRTVMGAIIPSVEQNLVEDGLSIASKSASQYADALLIEMARQELGVTE